MSQYALPLPHITLYTEENFIVSSCNEMAWHMLQLWPNWQSHALIIAGCSGSGKSHLSHIWAHKAEATIIPAKELPEEPQSGNILIEDIEQLTTPRNLFHLYNHTKEHKSYLLMTSNKPPAQLSITLPDLSSRLIATPLVTISKADDIVIAAALRKQFADRQLKVEEEVITYLLPRTERSLSQIKGLVTKLDEAALQNHKNITIPFVRKWLDETSQPILSEDE